MKKDRKALGTPFHGEIKTISYIQPIRKKLIYLQWVTSS